MELFLDIKNQWVLFFFVQNYKNGSRKDIWLLSSSTDDFFFKFPFWKSYLWWFFNGLLTHIFGELLVVICKKFCVFKNCYSTVRKMGHIYSSSGKKRTVLASFTLFSAAALIPNCNFLNSHDAVFVFFKVNSINLQ